MADTEREAFEEWARDTIRAEKLPLDRWPTNDGYKDTRTYIAFYGWKSGRAALASRPAEVDDEGLPVMPAPFRMVMDKWVEGKYVGLFTAEQYRQGQRDAVAAMASRIAHMEAWLKQIATVNAMDYEYQKWARQALSAPSHTTNKEK